MNAREPRPTPAPHDDDGAAVRAAVRSGLTRVRGQRSLPPWLFYDEAGSALFERITELPEYPLTRAERSIFTRCADEIVACASEGAATPLKVVELGAGTAAKSQILLSALVKRQGRCLYVPVDVSKSALDLAVARLKDEEPLVDVLPLALRHELAFEHVRGLGPRRFVLFIGSSIGNFEPSDARRLLADVRRSIAPGGAVLLGTDLVKAEHAMIAAYDDAAGVTAAFNKNVLARINGELGGTFDLEAFRHVAVWNAARARIEMHLESTRAQRVHIAGLHLDVELDAGERIHTESSHKYTLASVDALVAGTGLVRERTWLDDPAVPGFAEHVLRAV